jgi:hypothetical protein
MCQPINRNPDRRCRKTCDPLPFASFLTRRIFSHLIGFCSIHTLKGYCGYSGQVGHNLATDTTGASLPDQHFYYQKVIDCRR